MSKDRAAAPEMVLRASGVPCKIQLTPGYCGGRSRFQYWMRICICSYYFVRPCQSVIRQKRPEESSIEVKQALSVQQIVRDWRSKFAEPETRNTLFAAFR